MGKYSQQEVLKAQRATVEANVEEAKQKQVIEQPKQEQKKQLRHEQDSGFSLWKANLVYTHITIN